MKIKLLPQDLKEFGESMEKIIKILKKYHLDQKNPKFFEQMTKTFEILKEVK